MKNIFRVIIFLLINFFSFNLLGFFTPNQFNFQFNDIYKITSDINILFYMFLSIISMSIIFSILFLFTQIILPKKYHGTKLIFTLLSAIYLIPSIIYTILILRFYLKILNFEERHKTNNDVSFTLSNLDFNKDVFLLNSIYFLLINFVAIILSTIIISEINKFIEKKNLKFPRGNKSL